MRLQVRKGKGAVEDCAARATQVTRGTRGTRLVPCRQWQASQDNQEGRPPRPLGPSKSQAVDREDRNPVESCGNLGRRRRRRRRTNGISTEVHNDIVHEGMRQQSTPIPRLNLNTQGSNERLDMGFEVATGIMEDSWLQSLSITINKDLGEALD
ncbi:hypothetical protein NDU88_011200 [Pleurodeles waltl]|uniref:Uncharacterized protein n=1 Tax=Pleurodeles waltl TaxID=8319 RepID=A0AAV7S3E5_PLEWA|nr:hypothetical protein NDU88_011200 [Pleurodeles waltl]